MRTAAQLPNANFEQLLSLDAIDELVSERGLRTPFVRMSRDGDLLSPSRFTRSGGAGAEIGDQVADDKVLAEFAAGATLVLQALHRTWPPIQTFAQALASQLGHPIQVNAYVTPPQNTGFAPHYDVHDVFVLQFTGRKRWRVHEPVWVLPLRDQPWQKHRSAIEARVRETPSIDRVLEPGDMLYLPRGYIHSATSLDETSGHITIGVHPITRRVLADHILAALSDEIELRQSLSPGIDPSQAGVLEDDIASTIAALHAAIDRCDPDAVVRGVARHLAASTRPAAIRPFEHMSAAANVGPATRVRRRSGLRLATRSDADNIVVEAPDRELRFPIAQADAVRFALSGADASAEELPNIDVKEAVVLLAGLLRAGIVVPQ